MNKTDQTILYRSIGDKEGDVFQNFELFPYFDIDISQSWQTTISLTKRDCHIKLCFVVLKAWVEKQCKLSNLVLLSAGLGQRRSINKQNGGLGYLVFGCPLTSFALRKLGLFEFIFLNN